MDFVISINGTDRTSLIDWRSVTKTDYETNRVDTLAFRYLKYGSRTYVPTLEHEVIVTDNDTSEVIFGGRIISISPQLMKDGTVEYAVQCKDYTIDLDDELVAETYENKTILEIITDILPAGFTTTNVDGTTLIERISFNYQKKSDVIKTLADLVGYHWYIDYAKDIHFFAKITDAAPFNITDSSANLLSGSLSIDKNNSQLRNSVYILGGEYVGNSRSETYIADTGQTFFPLANKFSAAPTVTDNGVSKVVGVANLNQFADGYDVLWSFQEKYLQWPSAVTAGHSIVVTGLPLAQVAVRMEDTASVLAYGIREHKIEDKTIKDTATARKRGLAELDAYAQGVTDGRFQTYTSGLRSGQYIRITSTALGIDEQYIIQSVSMKIHSPTKAIYDVSVVSQKTVGMVEFLMMLLKNQDKIQARDENVNITIVKSAGEPVNVLEEISIVAERADHRTVDVDETVRKDPWGAGVVVPVWGAYFPTNDADSKRPARWGRFRWQ